LKTFFFAAAFSVALASLAAAQTSYPIPPRDPPFGKGNLDNSTESEPNRNPDDNIPPRDPPFGKGELRDEAAHPPGSTVAQGKAGDSTGNGEVQKRAKKDGRTSSAAKKDGANTKIGASKSGTKQDSAPKNDTD
jgi:hypothetical protein